MKESKHKTKQNTNKHEAKIIFILKKGFDMKVTHTLCAYLD